MAETERVIRPAAVLPAKEAVAILTVLERYDVSRGGIWNATSSLWQRYDRAWNGPAGSRGSAELLGTIAVVYDQPSRDEITIYKVNVTDAGVAAGWTVERLCDEALGLVGLTLANCPRADLRPPPPPDPFRRTAIPAMRDPSDALTVARLTQRP